MIETDIQGIIIRKQALFEDQRGWLTEIFRSDEMNEAPLPAMAYFSITRPGITRGPHEHRKQTDFFSFPGISRFKIHLWDNRQDSRTYGAYFSFATEENVPCKVVIPPGVVHAYTNIGTIDGISINCPDALYKGMNRQDPIDEIRYEDDPASPFKI